MMKGRFVQAVGMFLLAAGASGCVWPGESVRFATQGPAVDAGLPGVARPAEAGDRLVLLTPPGGQDATRLRNCVAHALRARLPEAVELAVPEAAEEAALRAILAQPEPPRTPQPGDAWLVVVRDLSDTQSGYEQVYERLDSTTSAARTFGFAAGGGQVSRHHLQLEGRVWDWRSRTPVGSVTVQFDTHGGGYVIGGVFGGVSTIDMRGGIMPFLVPVVVLPAGTTAMSICTAFGRALGDGLAAAWRRAAAP